MIQALEYVEDTSTKSTSTRRTLSVVALVGLALSLVVNVGATAGLNLAPVVWLLAPVLFVVWIPVVLERLNRRLVFKTPPWAVMLTIFVVNYCIIAFLIAWSKMEEGYPSVRDGVLILESHGRFVRNITRAEYAWMRTNETKLWSSLCLLFYFFAFLHLKLNVKQERSANDQPDMIDLL